ALYIAREEFAAGEQAADAAHMRVAVAADAIAHAVEDQRALPERLERLEAFLQSKLRALFIRPERRRHDAVRAEHNNQPLLALLLVGEAQAGEVQNERQ